MRTIWVSAIVLGMRFALAVKTPLVNRNGLIMGHERHATSPFVAEVERLKHMYNDRASIRSSPYLNRRSLIVRYAFLDVNPASGWLEKEAIPSLSASMCHLERLLGKQLLQHPGFGSLPDYMFYTNNNSDAALRKELGRMEIESARMRIVNLDTDPQDASRMNLIDKDVWAKLDQDNVASLRRSLADMTLLPPSMDRLLLGLDITFLHDPAGIVERAARLGPKEALYMSDDKTFPGQPYVFPDYRSAQCPGLLGDFVYISTGELSVTSYAEKVTWFANQKVQANRTKPPCEMCATLSNGFHAIDQFAWSLFLGEWTAKTSGCFSLEPAIAEFNPVLLRAWVEVVHDKQIRVCPAPHGSGWSSRLSQVKWVKIMIGFGFAFGIGLGIVIGAATFWHRRHQGIRIPRAPPLKNHGLCASHVM